MVGASPAVGLLMFVGGKPAGRSSNEPACEAPPSQERFAGSALSQDGKLDRWSVRAEATADQASNPGRFT